MVFVRHGIRDFDTAEAALIPHSIGWLKNNSYLRNIDFIDCWFITEILLTVYRFVVNVAPMQGIRGNWRVSGRHPC